MRRITTLLVLCFWAAHTLMAQDVIVTKQSERIDATIIEVSDTEVKYKKQSNPTGPTFTISTSKIVSITYSNGEVQVFDNEDKPKEAFDARLFSFLPSNTEVTRYVGGRLGYFIPYDLELFDGNRKMKFSSIEASFSYGYTFNNRFSVGLSLGLLDFDYNIKESNIGSLHLVPIRTSMISMPLALDLKYSFTSWNFKPTLAVRGGFMVNFISQQIVETNTDAGYVVTTEKRNNNPWFGVGLGVKNNRVAIMFEVLAYGIEYDNTFVPEELQTDYYRDGVSYEDAFYNIAVTFDLFSKRIK